MKVQILGTGCPKCKKVAETAERAVRELGTDAEIEKVTDINDIMNFGVTMTPALAIDGDVKVSGKIPSLDDVKKWIGGR
jgi:small redox-active disulfide protein 2